jgi:hypothetical protein
MATTKKSNLFQPEFTPKKEISEIKVEKVPTFYESNNNSKKYNWNEEFAEKVMEKLYKWFLDSSEIFYTSFARTELQITHNAMVKRLQEYPEAWIDIRDELDYIVTERLFKQGSTGKIDRELTKLAMKHLGQKWNDATVVKMEHSVEDSLEQAYLRRIKKEKEDKKETF